MIRFHGSEVSFLILYKEGQFGAMETKYIQMEEALNDLENKRE